MTRSSGSTRLHVLRGFSLLEMAVVLVIIGLLGALFWQLLPRLQSATTPEPPAVLELRTASDALIGFALAHSRLPCPDVDGDGLEDCGEVTSIGLLPYKTLGHMPSHALRYGVNRLAGSDLSSLIDRYIPNIPGAVPPAELNGFDLCVALRDGQGAGSSSVQAGGVPSAFALASHGALDADGDGNLFDGVNAGNGFAAPNSPLTADYDDYTAAMGFGELAQHLGCLKRLAEVNGAADQAVVARDLHDLALFYLDFRRFANESIRAHDIVMATLTVALAALDVALAVAQEAIAATGLAQAIASGNGPGVAAGGVAVTTAGIGIVDATANAILAGLDLSDAQEAKALAELQHAAAAVTEVQYAAWAEDARVRARAEDILGLFK